MRRSAFAALVCITIGCGFSVESGTNVPQSGAPDYLQNVSDGITTLQGWYSHSTGLYNTTGWWNSANAITVLVNFMSVSGSRNYVPVLQNTFSAAQHENPGFINNFYDDEGWWALAWIDAYDLTKDPQYLAMAGSIFADMTGGWSNDVCGGGIWWSKQRTYKNAIANELFLSVAAHMANRVSDSTQREQYLSWAHKEWQWFAGTGMINPQNLINDGLTSTNPAACVNNEKTTWSYNQGVILGGLAELSSPDRNPELLSVANAIADAAIHHLTHSQGILHDVCEPGCGADGVQFKGIFARNLMALNDVSPHPEYKAFIDTNAESILMHSQGEHHQYGQVWSGPFDEGNAANQSSALDALIAAAEMNKAIGSN